MKSIEFIKKLNEYSSASGTCTGSIAASPCNSNTKDPTLGSLFGGGYTQTKKKTRKAK